MHNQDAYQRDRPYMTKHHRQGFTIIEVMIVLAIAGIILLIIFLAVPALRRSARNYERRTDAGNVAAAISTYMGDYGRLPLLISDNGSKRNIQLQVTQGANAGTESTALAYYMSAGSLPSTDADFHDGDIYIGVLDIGEAPVHPRYGTPASFPTIIDTESIYIKIGEDCTPTIHPRAYSVWYAVETGTGGGVVQCVD